METREVESEGASPEQKFETKGKVLQVPREDSWAPQWWWSHFQHASTALCLTTCIKFVKESYLKLSS